MSQRILIPLDLHEATPLPGTLVQAFAGTEVILLGWYVEEAPERGSEAELRCRAFLHEQTAALLRAGADVSVEVAEDQGIEHVRGAIAERTHADAVYVPGPITTFGRLLVPLRDERTADDVIALLDGMNLERVIHVTLFHVAADESARESGQAMLDAVSERVAAAGISASSVDADVVVDDDPGFEIAKKALDYDAVVMGETSQEDIESAIFGPVYERVRDRAEEPVILVRRPRQDD